MSDFEESDASTDASDGMDGWDDHLDALDEFLDPSASLREQTIYEQLVAEEALQEKKRKTRLRTFGGLDAQSRSNDSNYDHSAPPAAKKQRTDDHAPAAVVANKKFGYIETLLCLRMRARDDPGAFPAAPHFANVDIPILKNIYNNVVQAEASSRRIAGIATGVGPVIHLDFRGITDTVAKDAFGSTTVALRDTVHTIYMNNNLFGAPGACGLASLLCRPVAPGGGRVLPVFANIGHITLNNTPIGNGGAVAVLSSIHSAWNGKHLSVSMENVGLTDGRAVASVLNRRAGVLPVRCLAFDRNAIGDSGVRAIAAVASRLTGLSGLSMRGCGASAATCHELMHQIPRDSTATRVSLDYSDATDAGYHAVRFPCEEMPGVRLRDAVQIVRTRDAQRAGHARGPYVSFLQRYSTSARTRMLGGGNFDGAFCIRIHPDFVAEVDATASFSDVLMSLTMLVQMERRNEYIAPHGARLSMFRADCNGQWYARLGGAGAFAENFPPLDPYAEAYLCLSTLCAGEDRRCASIVFALKKWCKRNSLPLPPDDALKKIVHSSEARTAHTWPTHAMSFQEYYRRQH